MRSLGNCLRMLREASGITQAKSAEYLTKHVKPVDAKSISKWENDVAEPSIECFLRLCERYGVNNFYATFFMDENAPTLNADGVKKANDYIELLLQSEHFAEQLANTPLRQLRFFDIPVSAGFGQFLDSDHFEWREVDDSVPEDASYAVRISGNSMEPAFFHKQWIYICEKTEVHNGDVGIFLYDGECYCKQLFIKQNRVELLSLNEEYEPIAVTMFEEFKVLGKVLS